MPSPSYARGTHGAGFLAATGAVFLAATGVGFLAARLGAGIVYYIKRLLSTAQYRHYTFMF